MTREKSFRWHETGMWRAIDATQFPNKQTVLQKEPDTSGLIFSAFQSAQAREQLLYRLCTRAVNIRFNPDPLDIGPSMMARLALNEAVLESIPAHHTSTARGVGVCTPAKRAAVMMS